MSEFLIVFVSFLTRILFVALLARAVLSWLNIGPSSPVYPIVNILNQITEPILAPIRRVLPSSGTFDFSPLVAIFLLWLIQWVLEMTLR